MYVFFFKQKTAYEMRISDWSSDVCSSDLGQYLEDSWSFIDAPGNIEFSPDARYACMVADLAIVVVEPEAAKAMAAGPILKFLDDHDIPHVVVINKMDIGAERVRDVLSALQGCSTRPLVLRQVPIRDGDTVTGSVDLVRERASKIGRA